MRAFVKVDLLTGKTRLICKSSRPQLWKARVTAIKDGVQDVYEFDIKRKCKLSDILADFSDVIWNEIKEMRGQTFDSVIFEVGV